MVKLRKATTRAYSTMSVPRPTPTSLAMWFQTVGNRIDQPEKAAKSSKPRRRTALVRAPVSRRSRTAVMTTTTMSTSWIRTIFMVCALRRSGDRSSSQNQVGQDVDGVPQRLALGLGVVGVEDVHGVLHIADLERADLGDQLTGVRHAVLGDVELLEHRTTYRAQPVVRVGQPRVRGEVGVAHRGAQHHVLGLSLI